MKRVLKKIITAVVIVLIVSAALKNPVLRLIYPDKYRDEVIAAADEYGIDPAMLFAVIKTESGFDPDAVSYLGARGLTQITEETFDWLLTKTGEGYTFDDLFDSSVSIKYGALFLGMLTEEFKTDREVLSAYHAGRGSVNSWLKNSEYSSDGKTLDSIPIRDTGHYVYKVAKAKAMYDKLYDY